MQQPKKGFYYHYRHNPTLGVNDCAYEVVGTAFSTESVAPKHSENPNDFIQDEVVIYRPLYENSIVYKNGKRFWMRPVEMFLGVVTQDGKAFPRFQKITDSGTIQELEKIRDTMYGNI